MLGCCVAAEALARALATGQRTPQAGRSLRGGLAASPHPPAAPEQASWSHLLAGGLRLLVGVTTHPRDPSLAWPPAARAGVPPPALQWLALTSVVLAAVVLARGVPAALRRVRQALARVSRPAAPLSAAGVPARRPPAAASGRRRELAGPASWARPSEVAELLVRRGGSGRLVVGRCGRRLVAVERGQSLLVAGPSQSGKTTGLAIPAILEWDGPVVATSVKSDLLRSTAATRARLGEVFVYDPTGSTGCLGSGWSPLATASTWSGARALAAGLCRVARGASAGLEDAGFWYAMAEKLIAPLLLAASLGGASMADVLRWVDTAELGEAMQLLERAGAVEALQGARASDGREDRTRSSVFTTAESVLAAFAEPGVLESCERQDISPPSLVAAGSSTLYLVAPAREQQRLQAVFAALLREVLDAAFAASTASGRLLDPPLLVVLDEAANVAPVADLDEIASTAAGHGVQLVSIWQDLAQIEARYGARASTVVNNHRAKLFCSGIGDPSTLEQASRLIGQGEEVVEQRSSAPDGSVTTTRSTSARPLLPADALRRVPRGEGVLVYGNLPPVRISLRTASGQPAEGPSPGAGTVPSRKGATKAPDSAAPAVTARIT